MIPKLIHQIWIGPRPRPERWMKTWREKNPSFDYMLWDENSLNGWNFTNRAKFDEAQELAGKADIWRYEILKQFGGLYIDADSECLRPLDDAMFEHEAFCCYENELVRSGLLSNGYLGSVAGGTLIRTLVAALSERNVNAARAWVTTGPLFLSHIAFVSKAPLHVYPSHYFIPEHYSGTKYTGLGPIYARQYWGSTREGVYAAP